MYTGMEAQLGSVKGVKGFVGELRCWYQIPLEEK